MLEFYKQKAEDENISEKERAVYREAYNKLARRGGLEELKKEVAEQNARDAQKAEVEDESCSGGGCKI